MAARSWSLSRLRWRLRQSLRNLGVRIAAFAVLGAVSALLALVLKDFIPFELSGKLGADAVDSLLNIIATSMLSVAIFSLSTLVGVYSQAGANATPRVVPLLIEDQRSQTVLGTFIGAFLFSLVGIIALRTGVYGQSGRVILFGVTIIVVVIVVASLVRWVATLTTLGRVDDSMARLYEAASTALRERRDYPWLGGLPRAAHEPPEHATRVTLGARTGFVQHIDLGALQSIAEQHEMQIYLEVLPGDLLDPSRAAMFATGLPSDKSARDDAIAQMRAAISTGARRSFDQDPLHGLITLSEIGSKALSPGINDSGTAVEVIMHLTRALVTACGEEPRSGPIRPSRPPVFPRLYVREISGADMINRSFLPLLRDGRGNFEVVEAAVNALKSLARLSPNLFAEPASRLIAYAMDDAREDLERDPRLDQLQAIARN